MEKGEAWVIKAEVTVKPEVKIRRLQKNLKFLSKMVEVSDADVDARLKSEQESQAELVIKEDEAAEKW